MKAEIKKLRDRIKKLEESGDKVMESLNCVCPYGDSFFYCPTCVSAWENWHKTRQAKCE